jgi:DNA-directed RNA polymerase subunit RPC12/RpoP
MTGIETIREHVHLYRTNARRFYYEVIMIQHPCPRCGEKLHIAGPSSARCANCDLTLDPTTHFQVSPCCGGKLVRRALHYACSTCGTIVASRFLFDEALFDSRYFALRMRESRERKRQRRQETAALLATARSNDLLLTEVPETDSIPGLADDLVKFLEYASVSSCNDIVVRSEFRLEDYRRVILEAIRDAVIRFEAIPSIEQDSRLERARRFTTLIFMEQAHELVLEQQGDDILVVPY